MKEGKTLMEIFGREKTTGPELADLAWRRYAAQEEIEKRYERLQREQPDKYTSVYEAHAHLWAAADKLWTEVNRRNQPDWEQLRLAAAEVGATAMRFLVDLCGDGQMDWKSRDWQPKSDEKQE